MQVAVAAAQATDFIGMPECRIILANAASYVACAPKSNAAVMAIDKAFDDVRSKQTSPVPAHLRDNHYKGAKSMGRGIGYKYPHDFKNNYVKQQYLPDELINECYYCPNDSGYEKKIKKWLEYLRQ